MQYSGYFWHPFRASSAPVHPFLEGIFPQSAQWAVGYTHESFPRLYPEEAVYMSEMSPRRREEFALGRALSREVLKNLGIVKSPLLIDPPTGAPLWPKGVVGSISHSKGLVLVVAALSSEVLSLGVDVEQLGRLKPVLWPRILTAADSLWLKNQELSKQNDLATLIFSAKEAFYKYQYPLTKKWLGFQDLSMRVDIDQKNLFAYPISNELPDSVGRFLLSSSGVYSSFWARRA